MDEGGVKVITKSQRSLLPVYILDLTLQPRVVVHQAAPKIWNAQCMGRFSGIIGQDPIVSKSNRLHVVIFHNM